MKTGVGSWWRVCLVVALTSLAGCSWFHQGSPKCREPVMKAGLENGAGLKLPAGLDTPDTRGAVAIIGGLFAYLIITRFGGMVAGTFALVFISAMGDRTQTFQGAVVLAAVVTGAGLALFVWGLQMHLPLWPGSSF